MVNLKSLLLNLGGDSVPVRAAISAALGIAVVAAFAAPHWKTALTSATVGAAVLLPHMYQYDLAWTLPVLLQTVSAPPSMAATERNPETGPAEGTARSSSRLLRASVIPLLTPIPYLLNLAGPPWSGTTSAILVLVLVANAIHQRRFSPK
jgi:hypothetical protein